MASISIPAPEAIQILLSLLADDSSAVREASMSSLNDLAALNPVLVLECCATVSRGGRRRFGNMAGVFQVMAFGVRALDEKDVDSVFMAKLAKIATSEMISSKELNSDWQRAATSLLVAIGSHLPDLVMEEIFLHLSGTSSALQAMVQILAEFATSSPSLFIPRWKGVLSRILPILGNVRDMHRSTFANAFKCWCQAAWQYSTDFPSHLPQDGDVMSFLNSAFELLLRVWATSRDLKGLLFVCTLIMEISSDREVNARQVEETLHVPLFVSSNEIDLDDVVEINQEESSEPIPKKQKALTSEVWKHFLKVGVIDGKEKCKCKGCGKLMSCATTNGTSHLFRHVNSCKLTPKFHDVSNMMLDAEGRLRKKKFDPKVNRDMLAEMIITHNVPFNFVEYKVFRKYQKFLNDDCTFVTRNTCSSDVMKCYEEEKRKLKSQLTHIRGRVCLTSDCWTACTNEGRMRPTDFLRVLNKQFLGIAGDTANVVAKKLTSPPPPPIVSRKPAFIDAFLYKMKKNPELLKNKNIWSRRSTILPEFVDSQVKIYNGKTMIRCKITEGKVGHKFGEFALTRKRKSRDQPNAKVKQLKKKK